MQKSYLVQFKNFSIIKHIYFGWFVWIFVFLILLLFKVNSDHIAPYTYLIAAISGLIFLIYRSPRQHSGPNILIFIITVLLLLDESAFGAEVFEIKPIYWKRYNYEVYDIHNLIKGLFEILIMELKKADWDFEMFSQFIKMDIVIVGLLFLYLIICRLRIKEKTGTDQRRGIAISLASIFLIGYALFTIYQIISLPTDPKNVWLFGYSKLRIILLILICIYIAFLASINFKVIKSNLNVFMLLTRFMESNGLKFLIWLSLGLGFLFIAIFQLILPFTPFPDYKAVVPRVTPMVYLFTISITFLSFVLINWDGIFFRPSSNYKNNLLYFFRRYPGYIYLGFVVIQLFISLLIDQNIISLEFIVWNLLGDIHRGFRVEENFELIASFELIVAGVTFRFNNFSTLDGE